MKAKECEAVKMLNLEQAVDGLIGSSRGQTYITSVQGEAATSDTVGCRKISWDLAKIIDDDGYVKDDIFNVDETVVLEEVAIKILHCMREENHARL
jgi:hypothetical protein